MIEKGFLKGHADALSMLFRMIDWLLVLAAGVVSYFLSNAHITFSQIGTVGIPDHYFLVLLLLLVLTAMLFPLFRVYRIWRGSSTLSEIRCITMAWVTVALLMTLIAFLTKSGEDYSRSWMLITFTLGWGLLVVWRAVFRLLLRWLRSNGFNHRHIVIIGSRDQAMVVADRLLKSTWFGIEISAVFDKVPFELPEWLSHASKIHDENELREYIVSGSVDQVWIALPHSEEETIRSVVRSLEDVAVAIRYVPDIFEYQLMHHRLTEMAGIPVVNISYSAIDGSGQLLKNIEDYLLTMLLLVIASPVMLAIAIGVKLSSPGPVLYRQKRVGWNGIEFTMFKFRTMPVNVERDSGPVWARQGEGRATQFGGFLRQTSLDELPQLFNVLMGEMSLIGPRPERPVFVEKYKEEIPHYNKKHLVKAGMTGWAQVHGWRGNTCLHTRIEHDLYYIENWSLWLDIKIIVMTVFKGLIHKNAY